VEGVLHPSNERNTKRAMFPLSLWDLAAGREGKGTGKVFGRVYGAENGHHVGVMAKRGGWKGGGPSSFISKELGVAKKKQSFPALPRTNVP